MRGFGLRGEETALRYGATCEYIEIRSPGEPTKGGPPAGELDVWLTAPYRLFYDLLQRILDFG
jgi:hypothetical protein